MKYVDEYRDSNLASHLAEAIAKLNPEQPLKLMEVCGDIRTPFTNMVLRTYFLLRLILFTVQAVPFACCRWGGSMTRLPWRISMG